jgi:5-methylthioadenosine/S-adenosylhomocysteine deaminase
MKKPGRKVIRGGLLLDISSHRAHAQDLIVDDDTIAEIGPPGLQAPEDAETVDAAGRLLMPGLVNAHTHGHGNLMKGAGDRWTLEALLNAGPHLNGGRGLEDKYLSCLIGGLDMIRTGATACYDLFYEFPMPSLDGLDAAARGYRDAGLRVVLAPMIADRSFYEAIPGLMESMPAETRRTLERFRLAPGAETLRAVEGIVSDWSFAPTEARLALAPTIPLHCSDDFILACRDIARDAGLGLHMHLAESKPQAVAGIRRYGKTLTAHLEALDFLGPRLTAAHSVWLDNDDIARLADHGASVAHNPGSNLRLGSGVAPVRRMRDRGLVVGIGTDGAHCADNQNMFEAMRLASFVSRIRSVDAEEWLATEEVLTMATAGSAHALGLGDHIGRLAPGFKADIVFLDLGHLNFLPLNDPTNQIVHTENGAAVDSVMVGGRLVLHRGKFETVDLNAIRQKATARALKLREGNRETRELLQQIEGVVSRFCIGLAREPYPVQSLVDD